MSRLFFASMLFCSFSLTSISRAAEIPDELRGGVAQAEIDGSSLFSAFSSPESNSPVSAIELELKSKIQDQFCDGEYTTIKMPKVSDVVETYYFLLIQNKEVGVQFGRHFRLNLKPDSSEILSSTVSSKGCVLVPSSAAPNGAAVVGVTVTHLLTPAPTEFHVFLSKLHKKTIYVGTSAGIWEVEDGKINFLQGR